MILTLDNHVHSVDLTQYVDYISGDPKFFLMEAGQNHCKLLSHLAKQLPSGAKVIDLGTLYGQSAVALATNQDIHVYTFDIADQGITYKKLANITFIHGDCLDYYKFYRDADIIFLDVAPHDGDQERKVLAGLIEQGFKGLLVCDDIYLSDSMKNFWDSITLKKIDVTHYGHWSGTGIVIFDEKSMDLIVS